MDVYVVVDWIHLTVVAVSARLQGAELARQSYIDEWNRNSLSKLSNAHVTIVNKDLRDED